jgi:hypothetical protein
MVETGDQKSLKIMNINTNKNCSSFIMTYTNRTKEVSSNDNLNNQETKYNYIVKNLISNC